MENSIKVPVAALCVAVLLCAFTFGSIVARSSSSTGAAIGCGHEVRLRGLGRGGAG